jgi:hypothetical protein
MDRHAGAAARSGGRAAGRPWRQRAGRDRHAARRHGTPAATATARSNPRNDLQHFGSPPTMPTACSDHRPVTRQRCSPSARRDDKRVRLEAGSSAPTCGLGLGHGWRGIGLQEQLLIDLAGLALRGDGEQLAGDVHQRTRVCPEIVIVFIKIGCCGPSLDALEGQGRRPVCVAAFAPDDGQTVEETANPPRHAYVTGVLLQPDGFLMLTATGMNEDFYLSAKERQIMIAAQPFTAGSIFGTKITKAAWHTKPSWYIVASNDRMISPDLAKQMKAMRFCRRVTLQCNPIPGKSPQSSSRRRPENPIDAISSQEAAHSWQAAAELELAWCLAGLRQSGASSAVR